MNNQHATTSPQPAARSPRRAFLVRAAPLVLLLLAALLPRLLDLGGFVTHDEAEFWLDRSQQFLQALETGNYAATAISTHPGVTTMWLGSAGIVLRRTLAAWGFIQNEPFATMLALMRLPVVLVHVAGILAGYGLLRRLLPPAVALLAALLWAADPFVIGYSRLLHVDALMSTFATLSILAACCFWHHQRHPSLLVLSAACGALAVLSKSPGLIVLPVVAALALWDTRTDGRSLRAQAAALALWGAVFVALLVLAWPAVWATPGQVYQLLYTGIEGEGAQPHMTGSFFLGQRQEVPGPLFYPVTLALRLTPWAMIGLLLLPLVWPRAAADGAARRDLAALAGFALLLVVGLSFFPKQINRYMMPIFPVLDMLAAAGLVWAAEWLGRRWAHRLAAPLAGCVVLAALVNAAWWHPYNLAYFNQALGGAPAGVRALGVGWGEGLEQAAAWLNEQPDITGQLTVSRMIRSINPYLKKGAQAFFPSAGELRHNAGYVVVYINEVQGGPPLPPFDRFYGAATPLHIVRIHGINYVWIYQVPPPVAQPRPATFGEHIHLRGFEQSGQPQRSQPFTYTLSWTTDGPPAADYWLFAHLIGPDGQRYNQFDIPYPTSTWPPGRFLSTELPLSLPASAPPGPYRLLIGLYAHDSGQRLLLDSAWRADPAISGPEALLLNEFTLR